jgi:hypothetical protein
MIVLKSNQDTGICETHTMPRCIQLFEVFSLRACNPSAVLETRKVKIAVSVKMGDVMDVMHL